jgi:hypothetical protein
MSRTAKVKIRTAADLPITDAAGLFVASDVEAALLELINKTVGSLYTCIASVSVGDWVYKTAVNNTVGKADANNVLPVIGIVASKPTSTSCIVQAGGTIGVFSGLTAGTQYFAAKGNPGGMTADPSGIISSSGMVQKLAVAVNTTTVQIGIKQLIEIQA